MTSHSPLRYPGGKSKLSAYIMDIFDLNEIHGVDYIEPFAGGAGVAISLLLSDYVNKIHINDLNAGVYAFWYSVVNHTEELCKLIKDTPVNMEVWKRFRDEYKDSSNLSVLETGFRFFFLNRANRSGIVKGGVIGGLDQNGKWKIDARYNKDDLIRRIMVIGLYSDRIILNNLDTTTYLLSDAVKSIPRSFIYLDPPYYKKAKELYQNHFTHSGHLGLSMAIKQVRNHYWVVSYDNDPSIEEMYAEVEVEKFGINYSAEKHYRGGEQMFFCPDLKRPKKIYTSKKEKELLEA